MIAMKSAFEYRQAVEVAAAEAGRRVVVSSEPLKARVNHGRLIADCPNCGAGIAVEPGWSGAGCLDEAEECYRWYTNVIIPADLAEIDAVLKARPRAANRNWEPGETVASLRAENDERLVPRDRRERGRE